MDNFDYKKYLASGMIHNFDQINEKKEDSKKGNKEEQKRMKHERAQKKRIQRELADAYLSISAGSIQSMEMVLSVILNLCKDEETHERLLTEVHVVQVMKPLLMMNDERFLLGVGTTCRARVIASSILDELGEEFDFGEVPAFDEDSLRKLKAVAKRWINGILSGALNSWIYAVELCHRAPFPSPRVSGLSWKPIGEVKPWGRCLTNYALAKALMSQTEFTQEEFDKFDNFDMFDKSNRIDVQISPNCATLANIWPTYQFR